MVGRHLFNDGAWFVVKMLSENHVAIWNTQGWHDFFVGRFGAFFYQEYPTLLASRLHVRNPRTLILIWGVTLYSFKPLGILLCYRWARDKRLLIFPVLTLVAVSMNSEGYVITETHLMTALFWAAMFGLMLREEFNTFDLIAMAIVSAPLLLCYETMAAFGVFLCAACVYRYFAISKSRRDQWMCAVLFLWYALAVVFAVLAILFPRDPSNRDGFARGMLFMFRSEHIGAQVSCVVLVLCALIVLVPERYRDRHQPADRGCGTLLAGNPALYPEASRADTSWQPRGRPHYEWDRAPGVHAGLHRVPRSSAQSWKFPIQAPLRDCGDAGHLPVGLERDCEYAVVRHDHGVALGVARTQRPGAI